MQQYIDLDQRIKYIPCRANPLSADVGIVYGNDHIWLYDVGRGSEIMTSIGKACNDYKNRQGGFGACSIVLSHFHDDHIYNVKRLNEEDKLIKGRDFDRIYASKQTSKYVDGCDIVEKDLFIEDGLRIHIFPIPSSHAKGCLGMETEGFCFVGDAFYPMQRMGRPCYNVQFLKEGIDVLKEVDADKLLVSHHPGMIVKRDEMLSKLEEIYKKRNPADGSFVFA